MWSAPNGDRKGLAEAIDLLAVDTMLVHAKDRRADGSVVSGWPRDCRIRALSGPLTTRRPRWTLVVHGIEEHRGAHSGQLSRSTLETLSRESSHALY